MCSSPSQLVTEEDTTQAVGSRAQDPTEQDLRLPGWQVEVGQAHPWRAPELARRETPRQARTPAPDDGELAGGRPTDNGCSLPSWGSCPRLRSKAAREAHGRCRAVGAGRS